MKEKRENTAQYLMKIILFFTMLSVFSCVEDKSKTTLKAHFTHEQIEDFKKINNFFIEQVLNNDMSNYKIELQKFLEDKMFNGHDTFLKKVDFNKQRELYASISKSSFNEIWQFCKSRNSDKEIFKSICPKQEQNTKFRNYLKQLSKTNDFAKLCSETIDDYGDYYMLSIQHYLHIHSESMDLDNFDNQFIISIFYLSENDAAKRIEKWTD